jgi:hypothetical protein
MVSVTDPYGHILRSLYFYILFLLLSCTPEAEWTPFQTHYFSEKFGSARESNLGPLDL